MRTITKIIIHFADTPANMDVGVEEIRRWHMDQPPRGRGWLDVGYRHILRRDGTDERGRPHEQTGTQMSVLISP